MRKAVALLGAAAVSLAVWACSDLGEPNSPLEVEPLQSFFPSSCVPSSVRDAARSYLRNPYEGQVLDKLSAINSSGCTGLSSERRAWEIMKIVETAFYARAGGTPTSGAALVNGVLACCIPTGAPFTLDPKVLDNGGGFGVRGVLSGSSAGVSNTAPVFSRDPVTIRFGSEDGLYVDRPAIVGVKPRATPPSWQNVAFGSSISNTFTDDVMLVTSFPSGPHPHEFFELNEAPNLGFQAGSQVDVVVCFTDGESAPPDPHALGGDHAFEPRVKRNGVLLQTVADVDGFCGQNVGALAAAEDAGSALGTLLRLASHVVMPEPLGAMALTDRTSIGFGGGASFFSSFSASNASLNGGLVFTMLPPPVVPSRNTQFPVKVMAQSGGGSGVEMVQVTLSILNNNGTPAEVVGTFTLCSGAATALPIGCTKEVDGVADFLFKITKAGGYIICATAAAGNFNLGQVCSPRFHVRN
jgi:hypothetical protein